MKHRRPIMPPSMTAKHTPGVCRWCGEAILKPDGSSDMRRTWHPACVEVFKLATWPAVQRQKVFERDRGVCAKCGTETCRDHLEHFREQYGDEYEKRVGIHRLVEGTGRWWQADHKTALCLGDRDMRLFGLDNLQTLCSACHRAKTTEDVRALKRAKAPPVAATQLDLLP